jgi:formamidopyrimidine-DNA glycosylase
MPERPDLEYVVPLLAAELVGLELVGVRVHKPVVLRLAVPGDPAAVLSGRRVEAVERVGPFVRFRLTSSDPSALDLVIHPMLAGRFTVAGATARTPADLAVAFSLSDGRELRYRDDRQMGKVYVISRGDEEGVPGLSDIGLDVLDPRVFTFEAFQQVARGRRDQLKAFLLDYAALDCLGNAYADETLWEAGLHPKARVRELAEPELRRLHAAIAAVLTRACDEIARRKPPMDEKLRDFLAVRGRKGQACPRCGATIRVCGMRGHDAYFCPQCQPDRKGRTLVDWRRLPG